MALASYVVLGGACLISTVLPGVMTLNIVKLSCYTPLLLLNVSWMWSGLCLALLLLQRLTSFITVQLKSAFDPDCRKELLKYVSETTNSSDGAERFGEWLSDHGFAATSTAVLDVRISVFEWSWVFSVLMDIFSTGHHLSTLACVSDHTSMQGWMMLHTLLSDHTSMQGVNGTGS
jgi:hypothetical protein